MSKFKQDKRGNTHFDERRENVKKFIRKDKYEKKPSGFQLYHAVCDKCGKDCDIPFKPTGGKPIYCRSCFREGAGDKGDRRETPNDLEQINRKLDKIIKALKIE